MTSIAEAASVYPALMASRFCGRPVRGGECVRRPGHRDGCLPCPDVQPRSAVRS
jgi:hypothetical protein